MGTHHVGFQFLLILDLWGISFHAVIIFGLGKNLLFKSGLGHCVGEIAGIFLQIRVHNDIFFLCTLKSFWYEND